MDNILKLMIYNKTLFLIFFFLEFNVIIQKYVPEVPCHPDYENQSIKCGFFSRSMWKNTNLMA